ncbi:choice-of-anchor D domain-containing protein [Myxococcota bacterium]|nr:choice-of-anchor D domain-containing protein [Myxococcota bacterium]
MRMWKQRSWMVWMGVFWWSWACVSPDQADITGKNKDTGEPALGVVQQAATNLCNDTLTAGQSIRRTISLTLPSVPPKADVIFGSDLTSSMVDEVAKAKATSTSIMNQITTAIPDTYFGAFSFKDYRNSYKYCNYQTSTGGAVLYGSGQDYPYRLDQGITVNKTAVSNAINTWTISTDPNTDYPASYGRALWELYNDTNVGWRAGSKRFVVLYGDALPHECSLVVNPYTLTTGPDPGRDGVAGNADDIKWIDTINGLKNNNITLITLYSGPDKLSLGGGPPLRVFEFWQTHSKTTLGNAYQLDQQGNLPNNANIAQFIQQTVQALSSTISRLSIELCKDQPPSYATWLSSGDAMTNVTTGTGPHSLGITVTPPNGTSAGAYAFDVCVYGDGVEYARQSCQITVSGCALPGVGAPCTVGVGACQRTGVMQCNAAGTALQCSVTAGTPSAEICDGIDNNCDGRVDETWPTKGTACTVGVGECQRNGTLVCNAAQNGVTCSVSAGTPTAELCDGKDNDCNGQIDETFTNKGTACTVGIGACLRAGIFVCAANGSGTQCSATAGTATAEICDGIDNNCNGQIDETFSNKGAVCTVGLGECLRTGVFVCAANGSNTQCSVSAGTPSTEICDGKDNNCNGQIDETFANKGTACTVGLGECLRSGTFVCRADGTATQCSVSAGTPTTELCDGKDNDCDGQIDENFSDKGKACTVGLGECQRSGTFLCSADGASLVCSASAGASSPEICDGKDNDCDGQVDEGCQCTDGTTRPCYSGAAGTAGQGPCKQGTQTCTGGQWGNCIGQVIPTAERCDGVDNDCDGQVDEDFPDKNKSCTSGVGACQKTGTSVCKADGSGTECNASAGAATAEICDGVDNNCNGQIDETFTQLGQACSAGVGPCQQSGIFQCATNGNGVRCSATAGQGTPEICDNTDNDCDGQVDNGVKRSCTSACGTGEQICNAGVWGACSARQPKPETCDNTDEDCDGSVDNGLSRPCQTACGAGTEVCKAGVWGSCSAPQPQAEICDGKDNDCNGQVDEGIPTRPCTGACGKGTASCEAGVFVGCDGLTPQPEVCDGVDNDCNGKIDDIEPRTCRSECGEGKETCINGFWKDCTAPKPAEEICDGIDNNCDGFVDNNAPCQVGQGCYKGKCTATCQKDQDCSDNGQCIEGFCVGDPCKGVDCPEGKACLSGRCVDACAAITCPEGQLCRDGKCRDNSCYGLGCPGGTVCVNGQCETDACLAAKCKPGQACRLGKCFDSCVGIACSAGKRCVEGQCVEDPCASVKCPSGEVCVGGKCLADPCPALKCPEGRICDPAANKCVDDPCLTLQCPQGQVCKAGECAADGTQEPPPSEPKDTEGGSGTKIVDGGSGDNDPNAEKQSPGGCGCSATQPPAERAFWVIGLLLLFVLRRRKGECLGKFEGGRGDLRTAKQAAVGQRFAPPLGRFFVIGVTRLEARAWFGRVGFFAILSVLAMGSGCNCDEVTQQKRSKLAVTPTNLVFPLTPVGKESVLEVELSNPETLVVKVTKLELSAGTHPSFALAKAPDLPLTLQPKETAKIALRFAPLEGGGASGRLLLWSDADNADQEGKFEVRLLSLVNAPSPVFSCVPALDFGSVRIGEKKSLDCELSNRGTADWEIAGFALSEGAEREFSASASLPMTIKSGAAAQKIQVTYSPQDQGEDQAQLFFVGKEAEPNAARPSINLRGQSATATIQVVPEFLIFPLTSQGKETTRKLAILSRGEIELTVTSAQIQGAAGNPFSVDPSVRFPLSIPVGQSFELPVIYKGSDLSRQQATLVLENSDPKQPQVSVPVYAVTDGCDLKSDPKTLNFPSKKTITVTLSNQGNRACTIKRIALDASSSKDYIMIPATWPVLSLAPNASLEFFVEYRPSDNVDDKGKIIIESDDADEPKIEIPLEAPVRVEACQLAPNPAALNFGRIPIGKTQVRSITLVNEGLKDCRITEVSVPNGSTPQQSGELQLARPVGTPVILKPSDQLPIEIRYSPTRASWVENLLTVKSDDPQRPEMKLKLLGSASRLCIRAVPEDIRFDDTMTACRARTQRVTLYNLCPQALAVQNIALSSATSKEFSIVKAPPTPLTLQLGQTAEIELGYSPTDTTQDQGILRIQNNSDALPEMEIPIQAQGTSSDTQKDIFVQSGSPKADILFVIDDSFSMAKRQQSLSQNLQIFLQEAQTRKSDFRIAVTTTSLPKEGPVTQRPGGCFVGSNDKILTPQTPNLLQAFQQLVQVGTTGDAVEQGLEAAYRALTPPVLYNPDCNLGFLRNDASLSVIFVTDEPDQSPQPLGFYQQFFESLRGSQRGRVVRISAITAPMPAKSCQDATTNGRYWTLAGAFGGSTESICAPDWSVTLKSLAASTFGLQRRFFLSRSATANTLSVSVDGKVAAPATYTFDPTTQSVAFADASTPQPSQTIEINYKVDCN